MAIFYLKPPVADFCVIPMVKSLNRRFVPRFRIDGGGGGAFSQHLSNGFFRLATSKIRLDWMAIFFHRRRTLLK